MKFASLTLSAAFLSTLILFCPAVRAEEKGAASKFNHIERLDPRFDKLIPIDAKVEKIATGFIWSEGPVWSKEGNYLLFSDIPNNRVVKYQDGKVTDFLKPAGYTGSKPRGGEPGSNGLTFDSQGRLTLCQHGDRRVARLEPNGKQTALADKIDGKRLNSPNDCVYHSNGDLYFTDPPYGLEGMLQSPDAELDFCGVYRISAKDGKLTLLTKKVSNPNGIALSPDEKTLYVANSSFTEAVWYAFNVDEKGGIDEGRVFYDITKLVNVKKGLPDGMKVDVNGNLFATAPGGVHVFSPDGTHLGSIDTGEATANCAWGEDGTVLYMCADDHLMKIKTNTKGVIPGPK